MTFRAMTLLALLSACGFANPAAPEPATQPATSRPVAAVWYEISYPRPGETLTRRLITGVWSDGTVVTSGDREHGGPPYTARKVDAASVKKLADDLDKMKFFSDEELNRHPNRYPPDASYTAVAAAVGDKRQRLALWRAPTTQPADADHFMKQFIAARTLINQLGDEKGEPVEKIDESVFSLGRKPR